MACYFTGEESSFIIKNGSGMYTKSFIYSSTSGKFYLVVNDDNGGNVYESSDGISFKNISPYMNGGYNYSSIRDLVIDNSGNIQTIGIKSGVGYRISYNYSTWTEHESSGHSGVVSYDSSTGYLYVIYYSGDYYSLLYTYFNGSTWNDGNTICTLIDEIYDYTKCIDSNGKTHIVLIGYDNNGYWALLYVYGRHGDWSITEIIYEDDTICSASITVTESGERYIAMWVEGNPVYYNGYVSVYYGYPSNWTEIKLSEFTWTYITNFDAIGINSYGNHVNIAWTDPYNPDAYDLYIQYVHMNSGSVISSVFYNSIEFSGIFGGYNFYFASSSSRLVMIHSYYSDYYINSITTCRGGILDEDEDGIPDDEDTDEYSGNTGGSPPIIADETGGSFYYYDEDAPQWIKPRAIYSTKDI